MTLAAGGPRDPRDCPCPICLWRAGGGRAAGRRAEGTGLRCAPPSCCQVSGGHCDEGQWGRRGQPALSEKPETRKGLHKNWALRLHNQLIQSPE